MSHQRIVWLASYPKSGNTWVRCFLDAYFLGEVDLNELVCSVTDDRADRHQIGDGSNIVDLPIDIQHLARPMNLLRLVRMFDQNKFSKVPLFVKTHNPNMVVNGIELLPQQLTQATIHIVRDPRDVLPSFAKHMGTDLDQAIEWMTDRWRTLKGTKSKTMDIISSWNEAINSFLNDDCHNVRTFLFEDMKSNPVETFSEMLVHAGITPDYDRVRQALDVVKLSKLRKQEQENGFKESSPHAKDQFFGKGQVGGWKTALNDMQKHKIEKAFGRTMKRLGYVKKRVA